MTTLAEVLPALRGLAAVDKIRLIRILAEDVDTGDNIAPFEPGRTYYVPDVHGANGAARVLTEALAEFDAQANMSDAV